MAWQRDSGYNQRTHVESQTGRWKQVIGGALRFHTAVANGRRQNGREYAPYDSC
jgi:hypothetical protein